MSKLKKLQIEMFKLINRDSNQCVSLSSLDTHTRRQVYSYFKLKLCLNAYCILIERLMQECHAVVTKIIRKLNGKIHQFAK